VRGAQLPANQPVSLRRDEEPPVAGGDGYRHDERTVSGPAFHPPVRGDGNGHAEEAGERHDDRSARDVYSFLTSFTAGVQRGLDETKRHPTSPEDTS
jgi:hypothetical protein